MEYPKAKKFQFKQAQSDALIENLGLNTKVKEKENPSQNKRLRFLVIVLILVVVGSAAVVWRQSWRPNTPPEETKPQPPTLLNQTDYRVEDRSDGKYVVVDKVGLSAKVPDGWKVEIQKAADIEGKQGFVNLTSPDAEMKYGLLTKGCGISIVAGAEENNIKDVKEKINALKEKPSLSDSIRVGYKLEVIKIGKLEVLKWSSPNQEDFGQASGINIPVSDKLIVNIDTRLSKEDQEKCSPIWETFIKTIAIR